MPTGLDYVKDVMQELGALSQGETPSAGDQAFVLGKLNRLIDNWNADRQAIYANQILPFTLIPSLSPHTIGPTAASFATSQRPVSIEAASLVIGDTRYPITVHRDSAWYASLPDPTLTAEQPTDLYYDPDWDNGQIYFYPVPSAAITVELHVRAVLTAFVLDIDVTLPPGYQDAITLTAAEETADAFGRPMPPTLPMRATKARARIFRNNIVTPTLATCDSGLPGSSGYFDYLTGRVV